MVGPLRKAPEGVHRERTATDSDGGIPTGALAAEVELALEEARAPAAGAPSTFKSSVNQQKGSLIAPSAPSPAGRPTTRGSGSPPLQSQPDERLLRSCQSGDLGAREELVRRFLPLTRRLAGRYRNTGESQDDLEQVAALGLVKAIDRYDPELGSFVRYAIPTVMGELKRYFRDKGWGVRVPRSLQERFLAVNEATDDLSGQLGRSPTPKEVSEHTGIGLDDVLEALEASAAYSPRALDAPLARDEDGERTLGDTLGGEDSGYALVELGQALTPAFRALPAREQSILKLRFVDDLTQSEIAEQVGVSQMHVSRLLTRSLDRLGAAASGYVDPRTEQISA